jgi:amino acid adenylation domain-containing protein
MKSQPKVQDFYPLSPMQSGLLFHSLYAPTSDAYFVQSVFELEGEINAAILKSAWQKVSDLHPILRTGFIWQDGDSPLQYVLESSAIHFHVEDWQNLTGQGHEERLKTFIQEDRKQGFDLGKAPLFRLVLIQYDLAKYYFVWSQHHILMDGWCLPIILRDVFTAYEDIRQKKEVHLRAPRAYRDYIAWLQKQDLEEAKLFWKEYLTPLEVPTRLSFHNIIEKNPAKDYDTYEISLSVEETEAIKKLAASNNLTLNSLIQGAVGTVLKVYTQQKNIVIGVTVSGRSIDLPGIEEMTGLFINTLPLIVTHTPGETNLSFLKKLQEQTQKLNDYTYIPLAQVQSWAHTDNNLFDVIFVFENYPLGEGTHSSDSSFIIKSVKSIEKTEYPLSITVQGGRQLHFILNYQTAHFNEEIIKRLFNHVRTVLQGFCKHTENSFPTSIQELSLLTPQEQHQLLVEWNSTKEIYQNTKTVCQLFEEQVEKTPHNTAVVYENEVLTYQQLNEKANQIAHYLREMKVRPDTLVAIAVERSLTMIVALLGILKAGGAYVPFDSSNPEERLQFMLHDSKASLIITDSNTISKIPAISTQVICLDEEWKYIKSLPADNLELSIVSHNLAYVIYTSGSTGMPKGVMIEHGNLTHYLQDAKKRYVLSPGASFLHSSIAFDMSITSVFLPLIVGDSIHVLSKDSQIDSFKKILLEDPDRFSFIKITPTHLKVLKNQLSSKIIQKQKGSLIIGGENLIKEDIDFWLNSTSDPHVFNEYGPTETTVGCCVFNLKNYSLRSGSIPIGKPINNTQIYILDTHLNPVPIGISGEIYIGGAGLSRGYLNRPDLTAERFIPNPFIQRDEDNQYLRLYHTGDLARYLPDGNIEFLGRMDDQVKIRGFRIELGEIEAALMRHGDVAQSVVIAREDEQEHKQLIAYVVPGDFTPTNAELIEFLSEKLPDYMIPSFFIFLDKVPLTLNGKLDRKSLPDLDFTLRQTSSMYVAPQTQLEQELSSIWSDILKIEKIGIHDNFFILGGHSLLATQVISRIRHNYTINISLKALFEHPTISALSKIVDVLREQNALSLIPPITAREKRDFIPLSFAQQRLWFLTKLLPNITLYNIPISFKLTGDLNTDALEKAFNTLINRHESLRTIFLESEGDPYQFILPALEFNLAQHSQDLTQVHNKEKDFIIEDLVKKEANFLFNLTTGPLMKIKLLILSKDEHILLITFHHIIFDGWSMGIFFKELCSFYNAYCTHQPSPFSSLPLQYADFAIWQRDWLQGDALKQQLSYWKQQLSNIPDLLELPTDKARPKELTYQGATHFHSLSKEVKEALNQLAQWNETTEDYPKEKTIHQLFEEQVKKTPHNVAVVYEDQELTYQQLNEKANQLAHLLQAQGVGPDTLVAIAVDRSLEMIIGIQVS